MFWFFRLSLVALGADFAWKHRLKCRVMLGQSCVRVLYLMLALTSTGS